MHVLVLVLCHLICMYYHKIICVSKSKETGDFLIEYITVHVMHLILSNLQS